MRTRVMEVVSVVNHVLETKENRHVISGVLMSVAVLCASLALTVKLLKNKEDDNERQVY